MSCGVALARRCGSCGEAVQEQARFCMRCGAQLDAGPGAPRTAGARHPAGAQDAAGAEDDAGAQSPALALATSTLDERRTVTVLFADLSGYTAVAERMDPESVKRQLERILGRLSEEVLEYGGHVDKFIGDNVMAIFGAPVAHGDDAVRAVRAGLGMQSAMDEINAPLTAQHGVSFQLRVGINTGEVLAGRVGESYTVIGDTVNVASRLQAAARPGSVTVGESTYRAASLAIAFTALGQPLALRGKREPVRAWEALAAGHAPTGDGSAEQPVRAPLVGRAGELAQLRELLARVQRRARPHLVTVVGEPGVGKSRLLRHFELELAGEHAAALVRHGACLPYGTSIAYWPLGEVIRAECAVVDEDPPALAWSKLAQRIGEVLAGAGGDPQSTGSRTALIGRVLGFDIPDGEADLEHEDPQLAREAFFAAVRAFVEGLARDRPAVLVWEDIHWADQGMLDLIEYLSEWVRAPLLQVCLARDELLETRQGWGAARRDATTVFLEPLGERDTRELIAALMRAGAVNDEIVAEVADRAEGNPLFAEEMVRRLSEQQGASVAELPSTVQALLAARLDMLDAFQRRVVAHAAVIGRTFWEAALVSVAEAEGGDLAHALRVLRGKDLIVAGERSAGAGQPELAFKHALIRDAAYQMLPRAVRARKHFEVAQFIEARAGERVEEVLALLAEHYGRAAELARELGLSPAELAPYCAKALHYLESAGDAATGFYSNADALADYEAALELTGEDADATARLLEKGADVALRLGRVDAAIDMWGRALQHHSARGELERTAELHRKVGAGLAHKGARKQAIEHHQLGINLIKDRDPSLALVRLYEEAAWLYLQTGDNMLAIYASEKALRLAERLGEVRAASRAHGIFGRVFGRIGDTVKARENLERAVELARGSDAHEAVLALMALGQHLEGSDADYRAAGGAYREALALAAQVGDVPAEIELHAALAKLALHAGDWEAVALCSEQSARLAEREGLIGKLCLTYAVRGRLLWREARWQESQSAYRRAQELAEQVGWSEVCVEALHGLSDTLRDQDELHEAHCALTRAAELCERGGLIVQSIQAGCAQALVHRLGGEHDRAAAAAAAAMRLSERVPYPVGRAAAVEASGIVAAAGEAGALLAQAREAWQQMGRPLEAARCELLRGERLLESDPPAAVDALARAASEYDTLGVAHLAARARELANLPRSSPPASSG